MRTNNSGSFVGLFLLVKLRSFSAVFSVLVLIVAVVAPIVYSNGANAIVAETPTSTPTPTPAPEVIGAIQVTAKADSTVVAGLTFTLYLNSVGSANERDSKTSTTTPTNFEDTPLGVYYVSAKIPANSDYILSTGVSENQKVTLTSTNKFVVVEFKLTKKPTEQEQALALVKAIALPAQFTKVGSNSTLLSSLTLANFAAYPNFTLDNPEKNKVQYLGTIDFSNTEESSKLALLGEYVDLEKYGRVSIDTNVLKFLNKKAKVTMSGIKLVNWPGEATALIAKDGKDEPVEVSNVALSADGKLSFEVTGFSTYVLKPRVRIDESNLTPKSDAEVQAPENTFTTDQEKLTITVASDNLDAEIMMYRNSEVVATKPTLSSEGKFSQEIELVNGNNRIRVIATLPNGEKAEEIITIVRETQSTGNNTLPSQILRIGTFVVAIIIGLVLIIIGIGIVRKGKKSQEEEELEAHMMQREALRKPAEPTEPEKPKYDKNLLTLEEKVQYDQASEEEIEAYKKLKEKEKLAQNTTKEKETITKQDEPKEPQAESKENEEKLVEAKAEEPNNSDEVAA